MHLSTRLSAGIVVIFTVTVLYTITAISSRDPTSVFFKPHKGYAPRYSAVRHQQSQTYLKTHDYAHPGDFTKSHIDPKKRKLCVGIPSMMRRDSTDHLPAAVGSLLAGLTPDERQEIYLVVFLAHSTPSKHTAYNSLWLSSLADEVLTYEFGPDRMQHVRNMEQSRGNFEEKRMFDYSYLLSKCADTFIPYVAIFEDDTVAMDGWYHRTMTALHEAEQQTALHHVKVDFLYLRLFYTEQLLGWNAEYWRTYLLNSLAIAAFFTVALSILRTRTRLTYRVFLLLYPTLALLILLFFALGRNTVHPMPAGVHEMPAFGCCNQALVYPNHKIRELVGYFRERRTGELPAVLEDYANENRELRYAVSPAVVQHAGRGDGRVWGEKFEGFGERALRREHERMRAGVDH